MIFFVWNHFPLLRRAVLHRLTRTWHHERGSDNADFRRSAPPAPVGHGRSRGGCAAPAAAADAGGGPCCTAHAPCAGPERRDSRPVYRRQRGRAAAAGLAVRDALPCPAARLQAVSAWPLVPPCMGAARTQPIAHILPPLCACRWPPTRPCVSRPLPKICCMTGTALCRYCWMGLRYREDGCTHNILQILYRTGQN